MTHMIKKTILLSALLLTSLAYAKITDYTLLTTSVAAHSDVVEKSNAIILKGINVDRILAEDGVKINFSTDSKLPITFTGLNGSKLDDALDTYVNGVITVQKNIFDSGVVDYKVKAEKDRKKALTLEYKSTYEQVTQELLNTVNNIKRLNVLVNDLYQTIGVAKKSIKDIKLRFTSGVGTVMDVRQAQLLLLDLEAEYQSLKRERKINLIMLSDEFGIAEDQIDKIQSQVTSLVGVLYKQQQVIENVINNAITYQRSTQIINLEKSALNNEIKSLRAQDWPQLRASITSVVYDIQNGFDEHEVYGGVDLTLPLFDSGLSNVKKRSISYKIKIQGDLMLALKSEKSKDFNELVKRYQKLQVERSNSSKKEKNLAEKLEQIKLRLAVVEDGLLSKLQTQLQLASVRRILTSYPYSLNTMNIDYWSLNEQLLEKITP